MERVIFKVLELTKITHSLTHSSSLLLWVEHNTATKNKNKFYDESFKHSWWLVLENFEKGLKTWKMQVEKESKSVGLEKEDALNRVRWRVRVGEIMLGPGLAGVLGFSTLVPGLPEVLKFSISTPGLPRFLVFSTSGPRLPRYLGFSTWTPSLPAILEFSILGSGQAGVLGFSNLVPGLPEISR